MSAKITTIGDFTCATQVHAITPPLRWHNEGPSQTSYVNTKPLLGDGIDLSIGQLIVEKVIIAS